MSKDVDSMASELGDFDIPKEELLTQKVARVIELSLERHGIKDYTNTLNDAEKIIKIINSESEEREAEKGEVERLTMALAEMTAIKDIHAEKRYEQFERAEAAEAKLAALASASVPMDKASDGRQAEEVERPMTGILSTMSPDQIKRAVAYDGPENHGDPAFAALTPEASK